MRNTKMFYLQWNVFSLKRKYHIKIDTFINKTRKYHWNKCPITIAFIISPFLAVFFSSVLGGSKTRPLAARRLASLELIWNCFWNILKSTLCKLYLILLIQYVLFQTFALTDVIHSWPLAGPICIIWRLCHSPMVSMLPTNSIILLLFVYCFCALQKYVFHIHCKIMPCTQLHN